MKIVVLAGGTSTERDVSLISGSNIYRALKKKGHDVILVDLYLGYEGALPVNEALFKADVEWDKDVTAISAEQPDLSHLKELRKDGGQEPVWPQCTDALRHGRHRVPGTPRSQRRGRPRAGYF